MVAQAVIAKATMAMPIRVMVDFIFDLLVMAAEISRSIPDPRYRCVLLSTCEKPNARGKGRPLGLAEVLG